MSWLSDSLRPERKHGAPTSPTDGQILMNVGIEGLDWQVDEYSRASAANALAATVQKRMAKAEVAKALQKAMEP